MGVIRTPQLERSTTLPRRPLPIAEIPHHAVRPERFRPGRIVLLGLLFVLAVGFITVLAIAVPVRNLAQAPALTGGQIRTHWPMAAAALAIVLAGMAVTIELGL